MAVRGSGGCPTQYRLRVDVRVLSGRACAAGVRVRALGLAPRLSPVFFLEFTRKKEARAYYARALVTFPGCSGRCAVPCNTRSNTASEHGA